MDIGWSRNFDNRPRKRPGNFLRMASKGTKHMTKPFMLSAPALALFLALFPVQAGAVELALTPSNVVSLWTNINAALIATGSVLPNGADASSDLKTMTAKAFPGKKPGDVLNQVVQFREKLDRLRAKSKLKGTPVYKDPQDGTVTPSVVFINSGHVLDSVVLLLNRYSKVHLISGFYIRHDISSKKPSDAYSMVELSNRRLDTVIAMAGC